MTLIGTAARCLATLTLAAVPAQVADRVVGSWAVRDVTDPMTDKPFVVVQTPLDSRTEDYLKVDCEDAKPYLAIGLKGVRWHAKDEVDVKLRIDKGQVTRSPFTTVPDDRLVVSGLSRETYLKLVAASLIAAEVEAKDGRTWQAVFKTTGTKNAMAPMLRSCPVAATPPK